MLLAVPFFTFGQSSQPLVPCEGTLGQNGCTAYMVSRLFMNVINFIVALSSIFAVIMFVWAGALMVTSRGNKAKYSQGKEMLKNVAIGLFLVLGAWTIVDTVMKMIVGDSLMGGGKWFEIRNLQNPNITRTPETGVPSTPIVPGGTPGQGGAGGGSGGQQGGGQPGQPGSGTPLPNGGDPSQYSCLDASGQVDRTKCVDVSSTGVRNCAGCSGGNCTRVIDPALAQSLEGVQGQWCASSIGIEPSHGHSCHMNGSCIDAVCRPGNPCTPEEAAALQAQFRQQGLAPVFELPSSMSGQLDAYRAAGVCAYTESRATGAHFSVYTSRNVGAGQFNLAGQGNSNCN